MSSPLILDVGRMRSREDRIERTLDCSLLDQEQDAYEVVAPVTLTFDIQRGESSFRLVGRVRSVLELSCSRCLEPYRIPVDAAFDLRYLPHAQNSGEGEQEIGEEDLATAYYEDQTIDLGQLIKEQFYLTLPMKPLCSDACPGLCPQCGANLHRGACGCAPTWDDPRLAPLKGLFKDNH